MSHVAGSALRAFKRSKRFAMLMALGTATLAALSALNLVGRQSDALILAMISAGAITCLLFALLIGRLIKVG